MKTNDEIVTVLKALKKRIASVNPEYIEEIIDEFISDYSEPIKTSGNSNHPSEPENRSC